LRKAERGRKEINVHKILVEMPRGRGPIGKLQRIILKWIVG
jgi:hypothetical protein